MTQSATLVIEPGRSERHYWRDLWSYRELFLVLAWRDVAVRYKQTVLGFAWAVLQPLLAMIIFTVIFERIARLPNETAAPYALLVFAGLLPWQLFSGALTGIGNSLVGNAHLIGKVYFPRMVVPLAAMSVPMLEFVIGLGLLVLLCAWYGFLPDWRVLTLPLFFGMALLASIGPGLWIASLNVKYRDFRHVLPFLVQFGLYVSPVGYMTSALPQQWRLLYSVNPMVGVIDGFRWALLRGESALFVPGFLVSCAVIVLSLLVGIRQFRKTEKSFADLI